MSRRHPGYLSPEDPITALPRVAAGPALCSSISPPVPDLAEIGRVLDKATFEIGWIITPEAIREAVEATLKDEGTLGDIKVLSSPYAPKDQVLLLARSSLLDETMLEGVSDGRPDPTE